MPRSLRIHLDGGIYHVTLRGNHRQAIFHHDGERTLLKMIVARAIEKNRAKVHAYCWMTNHLHLLVQVSDAPLGRTMQQIASEYARAFQKNISTTGHLFENRYHSTLIDTDTYLLEALRYVHRNPVEARMVERVSQYPWSSHAAYMGGSESWVTTEFALALFSPHRTRAVALYRAFIDETPTAEVAAELAALEHGRPTLSSDEPPRKAGKPFTAGKATVSLDDLLEETGAHFGVTAEELRSGVRLARLVAARRWFVHSAIKAGAATVAEIARSLRRDESTVRKLLSRPPGNVSAKVMPVFPL